MPGFIVTAGNVMFCMHVGKATAMTSTPRVFASLMPVVTMAHSYVVAGCQYPSMTSGAQPPCVTARFTSGAKGVFSLGTPLATVASSTTCLPTGQPMLIVPAGQSRVVAL